MEQALLQAVPIVQEAINKYLEDLEMHIGKASSDLGWSPLKDTTDRKYWYETGAVASHIVSRISIEGNRILAVAGLPQSAPGYKEALWNEFGWSPHGTTKVVRRALFIPLAEYNVRELNVLLKKRFATMKLNIKVKI